MNYHFAATIKGFDAFRQSFFLHWGLAILSSLGWNSGSLGTPSSPVFLLTYPHRPGIPKDYNAFSVRRKVQAEKVLEKTLKTMATKYFRDPEYKYVKDFLLPWNEHFP